MASVMCSKPAAANCCITMSSTGRAPIGTSGFGIVRVNGRKRVPSPPASMTARLDIVDIGLITREKPRISEPFGRPSDAFFECNGRNIVRQRRDQAVVTEQALDLAWFW